MHDSSSRFSRLFGAWRKLPMLGGALATAMALFATAGHALITTSTTVTSSANPSAINQAVTLTAKIGGAQFAAPFITGNGRSAGTSQYYRYELVDTTFSVGVSASDLSNLTTPAAFAGVIVTVGGNIGDKWVVLQVTAGGPGISVSDNVQFNFSPDTLISTSAIKFSVHDTASSAVGNIPANSSLVSGPQSSLISGLSPPFALTGNVTFSANTVPIAGCIGVAVSGGIAQCPTTFVAAGTYAIQADFSGDVNYAFSTGALTGGQSVGLAITPTTVAGLTVGQAFTQTFTAVGVAPYTFTSTGTLPPGLTLTAAGVFSGTPTTTGSYTYSITVTDAASSTGTLNITSTVAKGSQTISFNPPANAVLNSSFTLNGVATSGLPVFYSISTQGICQQVGNTLRFIALGACRITPLQSGDGNYFAAPSTERVINVVITGGVKPMRLRNTSGQSLSVDLSASNTLVFTATSDPGVNFRAVAVADLDGNKTPDLIYQNIAAGDPGDVRVWKDFDSSLDRSLRSVKLAWRVDAVGDLDGDGFGDLVWRFTGQTANIDDTGVSYVWFTDGTGVTQVRKRGGAPLNWKLLGAMDLNADGAADMMYVSPTNEIRALMATPGRTCANLTAGFVPSGFTALKAGSFIRTGRPEVLIRNATTGEVRLMVFDASGLTLPAFTGDPNDPNASCTASSQVVLSATILFANTDPTWTFFGTADFNGDGFLDIVWKRSDGTAAVWLTAGSDQNLAGIPNAGTLPAGYTPIQP